jgi:hypothetical protein
LIDVDAERRASFLALGGNHDRCICLGAFVEEVRVRASQTALEIVGCTALQWINWAEERIAAMDPASIPLERMFRRGSRRAPLSIPIRDRVVACFIRECVYDGFIRKCVSTSFVHG